MNQAVFVTDSQAHLPDSLRWGRAPGFDEGEPFAAFAAWCHDSGRGGLESGLQTEGLKEMTAAYAAKGSKWLKATGLTE